MKRHYFAIRHAFRRTTPLLGQLSLALCCLLFSAPAHGAQVSAVTAEAFENEPFLRFYIVRDGATGMAQSVDYFTQDDTAVAGVHYLPISGTARFTAGQTTAVAEVALIDNGQADGEKRFRLVLTNASPGLDIFPDPNPPPNGPPFYLMCDCCSFQLGVIKDNELRPTLLNTSFAPDLWGFSSALPDGRYLVGDTMLNSNGWVDASFIPGAGDLNGNFGPLEDGWIILPDGKILGYYRPPGVDRLRLVRLFPDGTVDSLLPELPNNTRVLAAQPDGKLLMFRNTDMTTVLFRVNSDGSHDTTFAEGTFYGFIWRVSVRPDGKILVGGSFERFNGEQHCGLIRLHANGSLDMNFPSSFCGTFGLLFRRNGKVIVEGQSVVQLDSDGALDPSFSVSPDIRGVYGWFEQSDGRIIIFRGWQPRRLNSDGSMDPTFAPFVEASCSEGSSVFPPRVWQAPSGEIVFSSFFTTAIDGFPCNGNRFLDGAPRPDFRPFTPPACSADGALIQIVRTGATTNAASVDFSTLEDTAHGGIDFLPQSGTLNFAPLEVSKTIAVPLLTKTQITNRIRFMVALSNPSAGYAVVDPIPVVIWPDLRLDTEKLRADKKVRLRGTVPGLVYILEWSNDLKMWGYPGPAQRIKATAGTLEFNVFPADSSAEFYRAVRAF